MKPAIDSCHALASRSSIAYDNYHEGSTDFSRRPPRENCTLGARRGWNQHEFVRLAGVSRLTVRSIFQADSRQLDNATVAKCARALRDERL